MQTNPRIALSVRDLTVAYHRKPVLWDVDLDLKEGALAAVVGPNGAGKSTMLKACLDLIPKVSGKVDILGSPYKMNPTRVAYVPQRESVDWDFPVSALDVVAMGLYSKIGLFRRIKKEHLFLAMEALEKVGIAHLGQRQISELFGGQQQRVFLARALVQDADVYFMDEPFAAVDAATERAIVEILKELKSQSKTTIVVHHDLSTIEEYFDWVVMINMKIVASGETKDVFNKETLAQTYGAKVSLALR